jgi:apolipoprotein N-acyltransferase
VNPSQDGWFGSASAARQQLALVTLRAIETRRFLVRPTAGGYAAVVDPEGRVVVRSGYDAAGVLSGRVSSRRGRSVYVRAGDWLPALALAWLFVDGIARLSRTRPLATRF